MTDWETRKVLILVRTYPTPSEKAVEVSCTAGVTESHDWIRLFPVPSHLSGKDRQFHKYQWIEASVRKARDHRPESYNVDPDSIHALDQPLPPKNNWALRRPYVMPLVKHCMCCLKAELEDRGTTLGVFKPREISAFTIERDDPQWTPKQQAALSQATYLEHVPSAELEKIPYKFSYRYRCDHAACNGHKMKCCDWELGAAYRSWRSKYGTDWEAKLRQTWEHDMIEASDTHFYVGTLSDHPKEWNIIGLWCPPAISDLGGVQEAFRW